MESLQLIQTVWTRLVANVFTANGITALCTFLMTVIAGAAPSFAKRQIRGSRQQAQVQNFLSLQRDFYQEPYVGHRRCAGEAWVKGEKESAALIQVMNFLENVGLLVKRDYLNIEDVWEMFSADVFPIYRGAKPIIDEYRKTDANIYTNLQYLYDQLTELEAKKGGRNACYTDEEVEHYWEQESKT